MTAKLYDYTYTSTHGYTYNGQVVADDAISTYNYVPGQSYTAPGGGTYAISGAGTPTSAPSGAVYTNSYTDQYGKSYDSYHYDPKDATYYDTNKGGYDPNTGMTPHNTPGWSGIGLGNEYSYINTGSPTAPSYQTYGGGGQANVTQSGDNVAYDYKFLYPDGGYYLGKVVDNGSFNYQVGQTYHKGSGDYSIYAQDNAPVAADAKAGYNYTTLYHDAAGNDYTPSDMLPNSPTYGKPAGYGGLGSEHDYIQKPGGYYAFNDATSAAQSPAIAALPLPV